MQYYRAYLDKQPNTDKRAEIDASISSRELAMPGPDRAAVR